jgi:hypothetical protein
MKGKISAAEPVCVILDEENSADNSKRRAAREIGVRHRGQIFGVTVP